MRRILVAGAAAVCLLVEGAGPASAASAPTSVTSSVTSVSAQAPARAATSGLATSGVTTSGTNVAFAGTSSSNETIAQQPERRRTPYRKKRRSGIGRFFGALAFLFIGLPLLLVAALVLFFMMRRGRKQREQAFRQQQTYDQGMQGYPQNGPYPGAGGNGGQDTTRRY